jgi:AraC-like DNA-binding protein
LKNSLLAREGRGGGVQWHAMRQRYGGATIFQSQLVSPALALVRQKGHDPARFVRDFALPASAETDIEVSLPVDTLSRFLDAVASAIDDPLLGVHLAQTLPRGNYRVVEYAFRAAPSLLEALHRVARYIRLLNGATDISVETIGDGPRAVRVDQRIAGARNGLGRHGNEFFPALMICAARTLCRNHVVPESVWFAHAKPKNVDELVAIFGTMQLRFEAGSNGFTLGPGLAELPLSSTDPKLLELMDAYAQQLLAVAPGSQLSETQLPETQLLDRVDRALLDLLLSGQPATLDSVARTIGMGGRTLQRRLSEANTSLQKRLDQVRERLAMRHLADLRLPLGEIAFMLGYAELSAFLRAFKRWRGVTPSEYRARLIPVD